MPADPAPPPGLAALQAALAGAISAPLEIPEAGGVARIFPERYPEAARAAVTGARARSGPERLASYNRQYWYRLLTVMQEEYPLLQRLLGIAEFNRLAVAYLDARPSRSPLLRHLSDGLGDFLEGHPRWGRPALRQCARLEWLYIHAFDAAALPRLDPAALPPARAAALASEPLRLQPHWSRFAEGWDLVAWRRRVGGRGGAEVAVEVTLTPSPGRWAIYRDGGVRAEPLTPLQDQLLARLAEGRSLSDACAAMAGELPAAQLAEVAAGIQGWFARWAGLGWFVQPD